MEIVLTKIPKNDRGIHADIIKMTLLIYLILIRRGEPRVCPFIKC